MSMQIGIHIGQLKKYEQDRTVPGGDALAAFAKTGVNLNWLLTGEGEMRAGAASAPAKPAQPLDRELLAAAVQGVQEGLHAIKRTLSPEKHAELILASYELLVETEGHASKANVIKFIRAAA